jgi:phenylalanine-4-hydroxylase
MDTLSRRSEPNLPDDLRDHCALQEHEQYTAADHGVWERVLARNEELVSNNLDTVHPAYVSGLSALELPRRIPRIEELNERLQATRWRTVCVDGYIPSAAYVQLMAARIFPVSRAIRRPEHIDYAPAPDLVHDVLGHLPLLFSLEHGEFHRRLAMVMSNAVSSELDEALYGANRRISALKSDDSSPPDAVRAAEVELHGIHEALRVDASELTHLARMYLWSIEFGLVASPTGRWVHGAALLSSPAEFRAACEDSSEVRAYSLDVIHHDIEFSDLQKRYFLARDFDHLHDVLTLYEAGMNYRNEGVRTSEVRALRPGQGRAEHA